jgi:hypothetical protein
VTGSPFCQIPRSTKEDIELIPITLELGGGSLNTSSPHTRRAGLRAIRDRRETHCMMLDHCQQTKNIPVRRDQKPMGLF